LFNPQWNTGIICIKNGILTKYDRGEGGGNRKEIGKLEQFSEIVTFRNIN